MPEFRIQGHSVTFWLRVKPGSRRDRLERSPEGELRLQVTAPAVAGRANEACVHFLARSLRLPQACVVILAGHHSRRKLLRVTGRSVEETIEQLEGLVGG